MLKEEIAKIISTVFYIGKIKYLRGIIASIVAISLFLFSISCALLLMKPLIIYFSDNTSYVLIIVICPLPLWLVIFIISSICANIYIRNLKMDSYPEIIINQVVGQILAFILSMPTLTVTYYILELSTTLNNYGLGTLFLFTFIQ